MKKVNKKQLIKELIIALFPLLAILLLDYLYKITNAYTQRFYNVLPQMIVSNLSYLVFGLLLAIIIKINQTTVFSWISIIIRFFWFVLPIFTLSLVFFQANNLLSFFYLNIFWLYTFIFGRNSTLFMIIAGVYLFMLLDLINKNRYCKQEKTL